ncbi:MAG: 4-hydroxybenzoate octaprenyltransferase [Alphaproteobacteria bacterium]|nr:4-hydroxybenzoate octaprenyltransferase [Alphaproteobacteria bacterium]
MTADAQTNASDIPKGNWVDRFLPPPARPYARLARFDRPIGTWLLLFPCWWSIALAAPGFATGLWLFVLHGLGALLMRGAGCTFNDIVDREFDRQVARTADRPIASGAVSVKKAVAFMFAQMALAFVILLQFNLFAIMVGVASLILVFTYPLMKRITWWPQFFLGLAFNWGALLGYASATGTLDWAPVLLYVAGIFWTLGYDTIYAHQDKEDDVLVGVKSSALRLGESSRVGIGLFYAAAVLLLAAMDRVAGLGYAFELALGAGAIQLAWQVWDCRFDDPNDCLAKFKSNRLFGWLLLAGLIAAGAL